MPKLVRNKNLLNKVIIIDGQPGCGKTMLSPIISSFKNVELFSFYFELEYIFKSYYFKKMDQNTLMTLSKILIDIKLYQMMMGREVNMRYDDLSSVFNYHDPKKYFKRILEEGDEKIPKKIINQKPILNIAMHDMMIHADTLFSIFDKKLIFIEVVRHPLYMLTQQTWNFKNLYGNKRDIHIYFEFKNNYIPYTAKGWEKIYLEANPVEKAIYNIYNNIKKNNNIRSKLKNKKYYQIVFESFVKNPYKDLYNLKKIIKTDFSKNTETVLKDQNIPRTKIADGKPLPIYKKVGWTPPNSKFDEKDELKKRRDYAIKNGARKKFVNILDKISEEYEKDYYKIE